MPDPRKIPDFVDASNSGSPFGIVVHDPLRRTNESYYREFAYFTEMRAILRPVRIVVQNIGTAAATDVRIELRPSGLFRRVPSRRIARATRHCQLWLS